MGMGHFSDREAAEGGEPDLIPNRQVPLGVWRESYRFTSGLQESEAISNWEDHHTTQHDRVPAYQHSRHKQAGLYV